MTQSDHITPIDPTTQSVPAIFRTKRIDAYQELLYRSGLLDNKGKLRTIAEGETIDFHGTHQELTGLLTAAAVQTAVSEQDGSLTIIDNRWRRNRLGGSTSDYDAFSAAHPTQPAIPIRPLLKGSPNDPYIL